MLSQKELEIIRGIKSYEIYFYEENGIPIKGRNKKIRKNIILLDYALNEYIISGVLCVLLFQMVCPSWTKNVHFGTSLKNKFFFLFFIIYLSKIF